MTDNNNGHDPKKEMGTDSSISNGRWMIGSIVLFSMIPLLLIVPLNTNASSDDQDLEVQCSWDKDLIIQYNDNGVGVSESLISPIIIVSNKMDLAVTIISVAVHMDWEQVGDYFYSWTLGNGSIGREIDPGEELSVDDVWFDLNVNLVGHHTYTIRVEYYVRSDHTPRTFITTDRSDFTIEFKKIPFIISFLNGPDVLLIPIPIALLGIAIYKIQRIEDKTTILTDLKEE
ncbi:MAG: hypothetical protein JXA22_08945 [Candidatus Thermoplasmatota archaeon]|nr:hypothetical protein [Candidatus Thermoplasmatota archaeon]